MGILDDDRPPPSTAGWQPSSPASPPAIGREARRWARRPARRRPAHARRSRSTAPDLRRAARPALLAWSARYDHLREVTRDDVLRLHRRTVRPRSGVTALTALRSLFTWAKGNGVIFRNPATRISARQREHPVWQPLTAPHSPGPSARRPPRRPGCVVALAAVHAARPGAIRALQLDDVDLGNRRLHLAGQTRPLDDLTRKVLT